MEKRHRVRKMTTYSKKNEKITDLATFRKIKTAYAVVNIRPINHVGHADTWGIGQGTHLSRILPAPGFRGMAKEMQRSYGRKKTRRKGVSFGKRGKGSLMIVTSLDDYRKKKIFQEEEPNKLNIKSYRLFLLRRIKLDIKENRPVDADLLQTFTDIYKELEQPIDPEWRSFVIKLWEAVKQN